MGDAIEHFRQELEAAGLAPGEIVMDKLTRCPVQGGKPGSKDGSYIFHGDAPQSGQWWNWRTGESATWTAGSNGHKPTEAERQAWEEARQRREAEQARTYAEAAARAKKMLAEAAPCEGHAYLERKGVKPCAGLKVDQGGRLLVPVLGPDGKPQSVQTITADGEKRFLPGGRMASGFFSAKGADDGPLLVAEGLATALTLHAATGFTCLVAFNAGNLLAVAAMGRKRYPEREIILAADDDYARDNNAGLRHASAAARAVGGKVALPVFQGDREGLTDFNDLAQAEGLEVVMAQVEAAQAPETQEPPPEVAPALPGPPPGWPFRVNVEGVFKRFERENPQTGETKVEWVKVCSRLVVVAETRDDQGRAWGRLLEVTTREGAVNQWAMPMAMLAGGGEEVRAELLSMGLEITPGAAARFALSEYISTVRPPERCRCVDRVGWHGGAFILPDAAYGGPGGERVLYQSARAGDHAFRQAGTLTDWQEHVARLCVGNSRLVFAVSAAFAAPLLPLAGMESGGLHLRGGSSLGKTTALAVAGSVWGGGGINGFLRSWRATSNGLESTALGHCDCLLALDEMGQVDGREAGEISYMLANGQGKARSRRDGSGRPPSQWRVLLLSTGELSLADKMAEAGARAKAG